MSSKLSGKKKSILCLLMIGILLTSSLPLLFAGDAEGVANVRSPSSGVRASGADILLATQGSSANTYENEIFVWVKKIADQEGWSYEQVQWSDSMSFTSYSLVVIVASNYFYRDKASIIKTQILDNGISLYIYGYYAKYVLEKLSLGQNARHGYGGFRYNYVIGNYANITTGFSGLVTLSSGSPSGATIERYSNFHGAALMSCYGPSSTYTSEVILAVWERDVHSFNGATGNGYSGKVPANIAFYGQYRMGSFNSNWDTIMGRVFKFLMKNKPKIREVKFLGGDGPDGRTLYAKYRDYKFYINAYWVKPPKTTGDIWAKHSVFISFDPQGLDLRAIYDFGTGSWYTENDPGGFLEISSVDVKKKRLEADITFSIKFTFNYVGPEYIQYGVDVDKGHAKPLNETLRIVTGLEFIGSPEAYGSVNGHLENGDWVQGGEEVTLTGFKVVYVGTRISPPNDAFYVSAVDEKGNHYSDMESSGRDVEILIKMPLERVEKTFEIIIEGVPEWVQLTHFIPFTLRVDPFPPVSPTWFYIHAESYMDENTEYDNDPYVYLTWSSGVDYESGVRGYYISYSRPGEGEPDLFVKHPTTNAEFELKEEGMNKLYLWAVDQANNAGDVVVAYMNYDCENVSFREFSPGEGVWINTREPKVSVLVDDGEGSGVDGDKVYYAVSTGGVMQYGPWQKVSGVRSASQVRVSVQPVFEEGRENYIKFRAKDLAGNGYAESRDYNVWVDSRGPRFLDFRPYEGEVQATGRVVVSIEIDDGEGSGIDVESVEYRVSTRGRGLYGGWERAEVVRVSETRVRVEVELELEEGDMNYVQFHATDMVGNYGESREYQVIVNRAPVVLLESPEDGGVYYTDERIEFDASGTYDPDGDELRLEWYSDIMGFINEGEYFRAVLPEGVHRIALVVNDEGHMVTREVEIRVVERGEVDPRAVDTDGDGMYDEWEERYGLDPRFSDGYLDPDHDGFVNLQEYWNGTDPMDSLSHPPRVVLAGEEEVGEERGNYYTLVTVIFLVVGLMVLAGGLIYWRWRKREVEEEIRSEIEILKDEMEYRRISGKLEK